jgi:hypothetical protein
MSIMVAIVVALPTLHRLEDLDCSDNPAVGQVGWVALGAALAQMLARTYLCLGGWRIGNVGAPRR